MPRGKKTGFGHDEEEKSTNNQAKQEPSLLFVWEHMGG
jgi:hypothetical protein